MKKIITGDTLQFEATANDIDGSSLTSASVTLLVNDFSGSEVINANVPHVTDGTYRLTGSSGGWGFGPVKQNWTVEDDAGTISNLKKYEFKIVSDGTTATSYVFVAELKDYFSSIEDYLDNQSEDHVIAAYKYTNRILDNLGVNTPVEESDDSLFDTSVRDHNAWDAIYRIVRSDQIDKTRKEEDGKHWFDSFRQARDEIYMDWKSKKITFKKKISPGEAGITESRRTRGSTSGSMLNNHNETYGSGFRGADYNRRWYAEIIGTGTSGGLRESTFAWSNDDGLGSTVGTISDSWIHLSQQVYVRFTKGTSTLQTGLFVVGDRWEWETNPVRYQTGGKNIAVGYG